jgi:hypothetical protein
MAKKIGDIGRSGHTGSIAIAAGLLLMVSSHAMAQSGSVGGAIGKEDKSVSGSQAPARSVPAQPAPPTPRAKSASRSNSGGSGGGSGGSFDGVWTFVGVSTGNCSGSVTLSISGGRLIGEGVTGSVSPNGTINAVGAANGVSGVSTGRLSGTTGSGTWQQSDGCSNRWIAQKQ